MKQLESKKKDRSHAGRPKKKYSTAALGRVISGLRQRPGGRPIPTDDAGEALGIGGSTLRMVESGAVVVPPNVGFGLVRVYGLSLAPTMAVVGLAIAIDRCARSSEAIDAAKHAAVAEPRLGFFANAVAAAYEETEDPVKALELVQAPALTERLRRFMLDPLIGRGIADDVLRLPIQIAQSISPVHFDAIAALAASLADWPVHIGSAGLDGWEAKHADRIRRVFTYQSDPRLLSTTADKFRWDFLRRQDVAFVTRFVVASRRGEDARKAVDALVKQLSRKGGIPSKLRDAIDVVDHISEEDANLFENLLLFDTRKRARIKREDVVDEGAVVSLKNLLIYELEAPKPFEGSVLVGFVDDAEPNKPQSYGVALSSTDVSEAQALFKKVSPDE